MSNYLQPEINVRRGDVLAAWSGIRPLVRDPKQAKSEGRKTRTLESPTGSRFTSPALMDVDSFVLEEGADLKPLLRRGVFFCDTVFYTLLRLLEVAY